MYGKILLLTVGSDMKTFYRSGTVFPKLNITITEILFNHNYWVETGIKEFKVYCKNVKNEERLFVTVTNMPTHVQEDVNDELINNV